MGVDQEVYSIKRAYSKNSTIIQGMFSVERRTINLVSYWGDTNRETVLEV